MQPKTDFCRLRECVRDEITSSLHDGGGRARDIARSVCTKHRELISILGERLAEDAVSCATGHPARWLKGNKPPRVSDDYPSTVWQLPTVKVGEKTEHPTLKPVEVFAIPMRQHTRPGEVCYEPFSGSGSQIIAGETAGRRVYAIEISPQYVDVAVRRWQRASGNKARLDGDGRTFEETAGERLPRAA